jgi:hypothetical protein
MVLNNGIPILIQRGVKSTKKKIKKNNIKLTFIKKQQAWKQHKTVIIFDLTQSKLSVSSLGDYADNLKHNND